MTENPVVGSGSVLKARRIAAGFKQNRFASLLGIVPQRLSQYETGRKKIPETVWRTAEAILDEAPAIVTAASAGEVFTHPLTLVRARNQWSMTELARLLARAVGGSDDRAKVWRWEHWSAVPNDTMQAALAELVGVPMERVAALPWPAWLPGPEGADVESAWNFHGTMAALDATVGEAIMDRRGFLTLSTSAIAGVAQRWAAISPIPADAISGGSVDDLVKAFEARLPELRAREHLQGGGAARDILDTELRTAKVMLRQPLGSASSRRLEKVVAELARLAGWACVDSGMQSAAERYFVTGLRAAYDAADPVLGANIIKSMSLLYLESERAPDAQVLVAAARRATAGASLRVQAMIRVRQARAEAFLGNGKGCDVLLGEATDLLDRGLDCGDHPAEVAYFGLGELAAQSAACHQILGRHTSTVRLLEAALRKQPSTRQRDHTTYTLWLSESVLAQGEVERACALLEEAIPAVAAGSSARNRARLTMVRGRLEAYGDLPAVKALDERARSLIA
jgi:tetratricopeptide (TPR) repeat protein/DNA-binding XRE family transcriptional regulator